MDYVHCLLCVIEIREDYKFGHNCFKDIGILYSTKYVHAYVEDVCNQNNRQWSISLYILWNNEIICICKKLLLCYCTLKIIYLYYFSNEKTAISRYYIVF